MTCLRYPNSDPYYPGHVIHLRGDEDPHEFVRAMPRQVESSSSAIAVQRNGIRASRKVRRRASRSTVGVSTERPQPVSLHLTSRGLAATRPHLEEGGIVVDPTVPETDPERLVYGQCECCGRPQTRKARDRNRMHFDCWADHHCGPDNPWPPGHQCRTPRSDD